MFVGDRSHPNLVKLDSLELSYIGWEEDFKEAEEAHNVHIRFRRLLHKLESKQSIHEGDRSHVRLVALDSLVLTYPGWQADVKDAEETHYNYDQHWESVFRDKIEALKGKQRIFMGDRSHPNLVKLDSLQLSYPGWHNDFREAEEAHNGDGYTRFRRLLHKLESKQSVYDGDRSHPRLLALDALELSYPGWQVDVKDAEETHYNYDENWESVFRHKLEALRGKQRIFRGDRSHPNLMQLDALRLSYPGWEIDFREAEEVHNGDGYTRFRRLLHKLKSKQSVYDGDRSHPRLVALDSLILTYPGWEVDVRDAEEAHFNYDQHWESVFRHKLEALRAKQRIFRGDRSHPNLMKLDSLRLSYHGWREDFREAEEAHNGEKQTWFQRILHKMECKQAIHDGDRSHTRLKILDSLALSYPGWQADVHNAEETHFDYDEPWECVFQDKLDRMKNRQIVYDDYCKGNGKYREFEEDEHSTAESNPKSKSHRQDKLGLCIICKEASQSHLFVPCGHLCVCKSCAEETLKRYECCPICRGRAKQIIRVYLP